jgi:hypothetical protein
LINTRIGRYRITKEGAGPQVVQAELDRFIELPFRDSEAYRLALKLYTGRYKVIGGRNARDILRQVVAKHMPRESDQAPPVVAVRALAYK